jgi:hypothetical protein
MRSAAHLTYLLLGDAQDGCCQRVVAALEAGGYDVSILANPLVAPARFAWWLDNQRSASQLLWDDGVSLRDEQIDAVLVRTAGWLAAEGWPPGELTYVQAEVRAALLGWLWSLPCTIVNRYPAHLWYQPQAPLISWQALLWRCGLPAQEALVTNVADDARAFGGGSELAYTPLTSNASYPIDDEAAWAGLATMQQYAPVHLARPHGLPHWACVVGEKVVWDNPSVGAANLESKLRDFARQAGLNFVALAFAPTDDGLRTVAVEVQPQFDRFGATAQQEIVAALVALLTAR